MGPPDTGPYIAVCIYYMCVCEQVCVYGGKWENIGNRFQDLLRHLGEVKQKYMLHITIYVLHVLLHLIHIIYSDAFFEQVQSISK